MITLNLTTIGLGLAFIIFVLWVAATFIAIIDYIIGGS